jgi:hypothetical protein
LLAVLLLAGAWMFYQLALGASRALGRETRAAADLFRLPLLDSLRIEMPVTPDKEREIWTDLRRFVTQGDIPTHFACRKTLTIPA